MIGESAQQVIERLRVLVERTQREAFAECTLSEAVESALSQAADLLAQQAPKDTHALALKIVRLLKGKQPHGQELADAADVQALIEGKPDHD